MSELAIPNHNGAMMPAAPTMSPLVQWAYEAQQAEQIATSLARTSFVPASLRGKPQDVTAAILAGQELGLQPMATLRSMDVIQGTPALRAHAMRGLVQSCGHSVQMVKSTPELCVMRGRRKGEEEWQQVEWDLKRAELLGLLGKSEWKKQPQTMLVARATGEICRLIASDVLFAMPYAAEELGDPGEQGEAAPAAGGRVTTAEILGRGTTNGAQPAQTPAVARPSAELVDRGPVDDRQLRELNILMSDCGITSHSGKGSTALNDTARFAWLADFLGHPVGSTKELTFDEASRLHAHLKQMQVERVRQRAEGERQIGTLFDGLDSSPLGAERLRDLSQLLGRTINVSADLSDSEVADVVDVLTGCQGKSAAWDAAIKAMEAERRQGGEA